MLLHPLTGKKVAIWISDYVLVSYGTGAVMAVPCGDQRDWLFANHFNIDIINIFKDKDISNSAYEGRDAIIANSKFLDGLSCDEAIKKISLYVKENKIGDEKINFRLRDAVFSRQRYWGEPFPVYYKKGLPYMIDEGKLHCLRSINIYQLQVVNLHWQEQKKRIGVYLTEMLWILMLCQDGQALLGIFCVLWIQTTKRNLC